MRRTPFRNQSGFARKIAVLLLLVASSPFSAVAQVNPKYFLGTVTADTVELKEEPRVQSKTLAKLPKNSRVTALPVPKNGFLRVRAKAGLGWIWEGSLSLNKDVKEWGGTSKTAAAKAKGPWLLKLQSGLYYPSMGAAKSALGPNRFGSSPGLGLEIGVPLSMDFHLIVKAERYSKILAGRDATTANDYEISFSSLETSVGVGWIPLRTANSFASVGMLLGSPLPTRLQITATNLPAPNTTTFTSGGPFGALAVSYYWKLTSRWIVFGDASYRKTFSSARSTITQQGEGSDFFKDTNGNLQAPTLDISGTAVNIGVGIAL